jgi:hypothetical protein
MSAFSNAAARVNAACLRSFGFLVSYQQPGVDKPFTITAVRGVRDAQENDSAAAYEAIWTTLDQFVSDPPQETDRLPLNGDAVTIGDIDYVVHDSKPDLDPDSDGLRIYLKRRRPLKH